MDPGGTKNKLSALDKELHNVFEIGDLKVVFKTMPQDLELLGLKKKTPVTPSSLFNIQQPSTKEIILQMDEAKKEKKGERQGQIKNLYQEAKSLYKRQFYEEAAKKFAEVLGWRRGHWRAKWFLYRAQRNAKKYPESILWAQRKAEQKASAALRKSLAAEKRPSEEHVKAPIPIRPSAPLPPAIEKPTGKTKEEERMARIEGALSKIKQEAEEKTRKELLQKLQTEQKIKEGMARRIAKEEEERKRLIERVKMDETQQRRLEEELRESQRKAEQLKTRVEAIPSVPPAAAEQRPLTQAAAEPGFLAKIKYFLSPQLLKVLGTLTLIVIVASGIIYWIGWKKIAPPPETTPPPPTETILPQSLFPTEETTTITLKIGQKKILSSELEKLMKKEQNPGTFTRILVKFISEDGAQEYASLVDLIDALRVSFPSEVLTALENNYTLFIYSQKEILTSPFAIGLGQNKLGLIIKIAKKEDLGSKFLSWENTMNQDLDALFLGKKISFTSQLRFEDIPYRDVLIRTLYLPNRFSCLNYTFYDNKVMISTSLETTQALIDKLTPTQ